MSHHKYNLDTIVKIINFLEKMATRTNRDATIKLAAYRYIYRHRNLEKYSEYIYELLSWNESSAKVYTWIDNIRNVIELLNKGNSKEYFEFHTFESNTHYNYRYSLNVSYDNKNATLQKVADDKFVKTVRPKVSQSKIEDDFDYVRIMTSRRL